MNKKLHFTWWHIFSFIAIIFIAYSSFMGIAFETGGNFLVSGIVAASVVLVFVLFFLTPQQLKATESAFKTCIWVERTLLTLAIPITLAFALAPQSPFVHFSSIVQKSNTIVEKYSETINSIEYIIQDYEKYDSERESLLAQKQSSENLNEYEMDNRKEVLHALLIPNKYVEYKKIVLIPYTKKAGEVNVWNVHTVSNLSNIQATADSLVMQLGCQSSKILSFEDVSNVSEFDGSQSLSIVSANVNGLRELFQDNNWSWLAAICALLASFFMIIPYLAQQRNAKNWYRLFSNDGRATSQSESTNNDDIDVVL